MFPNMKCHPSQTEGETSHIADHWYTPYARGRSWSLLHALHPSPLRSCLLPLRTLRPLQWFSPQRHVPLQLRSTVQLTLGKHTNFQEPKITNQYFNGFGIVLGIICLSILGCFFGSAFLPVFLAICSILELEAAISTVFAIICNISELEPSFSIVFATFWCSNFFMLHGILQLGFV